MAYGLYGKYKWSDLNYDTLITMVKEYNDNKSNLAKIDAAYKLAKREHDKCPPRASGEPYIIHPVIVANFLAIMKCDVDTICAGLLHDIIEDTDVTKDDLAEQFGEDVAEIVDGVTKITKSNLDQKDLKTANTKKLVDSLLYDPRIMIVKLADRLHNMLTIGYKTPQKQESKAYETLEYFAPLANRLGMYRIQKELENSSLKVLHPLDYNELLCERNKLKKTDLPFLEDMLNHMIKIITDNIKTIGHFDSSEFEGLKGEELQAKKEELTKKVLFVGRDESRTRIKHIYGMYVALKEQDMSIAEILENSDNLEKIHDLRVIKLIVNDIDSAYSLLRFIHEEYKNVNGRLKDYNSNNPKPNGYQSLHTTVVANNKNSKDKRGKYVQFQLRTLAQENLDTFGLAWELYKFEGPNARKRILKRFKNYPIYNEISSMQDLDLDDYAETLESKVLCANQIIVINKDTGINISLPEHATIHDFAYKVGGNAAIHLCGAVLNDKRYSLRLDENGSIDENYYPFGEELKNGDEISVLFNKNIVTPIPNNNLEIKMDDKIAEVKPKIKMLN